MEDNNNVQGKINDLSYKVEKKLDDKDRRRSINNLIGVIVTIACTIGILVATSIHWPITIPMSLVIAGSLSAIGTKIKNDSAKAEIDRYNQELEHLEKVEDDGLKNSKDLTWARKKRIESISEDKDELEHEVSSNKDLSAISAIITLTSAVLTSILSPWFALPAVAAELLSLSFGLDELEKNVELQRLCNRIDNLNNDLEVTKVMDEEENKTTTSIPEVKPFYRTKTKSQTPREKAVDEYIEKLATPEENASSKTYRKVD